MAGSVHVSEMATEADSTHPTGMHSCILGKFSQLQLSFYETKSVAKQDVLTAITLSIKVVQ